MTLTARNFCLQAKSINSPGRQQSLGQGPMPRSTERCQGFTVSSAKTSRQRTRTLTLGSTIVTDAAKQLTKHLTFKLRVGVVLFFASSSSTDSTMRPSPHTFFFRDVQHNFGFVYVESQKRAIDLKIMDGSRVLQALPPGHGYGEFQTIHLDLLLVP